MKLLLSLLIAYIVHDAAKIPLVAVADTVKTLLAFDFDGTIMDVEVDQTIIKTLLGIDHLPFEYDKTLHGAWPDYMSKVFSHMHQNGFGEEHYRGLIGSVPFAPGMEELIHAVGASKKHEMIIISDSNSFFINAILKHHKLSKYFRKVFTNPAHFDESGRLIVEYYHNQTECALSNPSLCKGRVLNEYVEERLLKQKVRLSPIFYVGDGGNDFCPVVNSLKHADFVFARKGMSLERKVEKEKKEPAHHMTCDTRTWSDAADIAELLGLKLKLKGEKSG